jgi:hypothetical protein
MTRKDLAVKLVPILLACIREQRKNRVARAEVREAILRVRQLRGIIECDSKVEPRC